MPDTLSAHDSYSFDGQTLRLELTLAWEESDGSTSDLRLRAVKILKPAMALGRAHIFDTMKTQGAGLSTARALSRHVDEIISALWDFTLTHVYRARNPTEGERLSLVAVGGYGRGELAPFSDIDLLFLRAWKETPHAESVIEFILYTLWDLGLKVGHASRTVEECIRYARDDHTIMTSLLEHRLIAGDRELEAHLTERLSSETLKPSVAAFIAAKLNERDIRHNKSGLSRYVVEPNIKEGRGGLRDLHTLFWIAKYLSAAQVTHQAKNALDALLTDKERQIFKRAFDFLWKVRILVHLIAGRGEDRLSFDLQPEVTRRMGFVDRHGAPAVERFMRRYFVTTKEVGALTRIFCTKLEEQQTKPLSQLAQIFQSGLLNLSRADHPGFVVIGHRLSVKSPDIFVKSPAAMFKLFKMADRLELDLHPDAFTAIARNLELVTPSLRRDKEAAKIFLSLLGKGKNPYRMLSMMSETGLLGRYIPEYGRIIAQTQFNMYHAYTVDEHTLRAIDVIHGIDTGLYQDEHPLASMIMPNLQDKESLYLAMLLHDTGKGDDEGQEIGGEAAALKACARLGLEDWKTEQVAWLVRHHLVLSDYAQKRDVSDPETIAAFAKIVESPERLRLLLVLTVADIRAVGPGVWNAWKGQLMRQLFAATEAVFRGGRNADPQDVVQSHLSQASIKKRQDLGQDDRDLLSFLDDFDESYLLSATNNSVRNHAALAKAAHITGSAVAATIDLTRNATEVSIVTDDRNGLFADLSGALANVGANVVGASAFTSHAGQALDIFYIQDGAGQPYGLDQPHRLTQLQISLERAALGTVPVAEKVSQALLARTAVFAIAPTVVFDDTSTHHATIIEVSGRDRRGLLADVARILNEHGADIASAHVDCYGERAVDAFYVTDHESRKQLRATQKSALRKALMAALESSAGPQSASNSTARASTKR